MIEIFWIWYIFSKLITWEFIVRLKSTRNLLTFKLLNYLIEFLSNGAETLLITLKLAQCLFLDAGSATADLLCWRLTSSFKVQYARRFNYVFKDLKLFLDSYCSGAFTQESKHSNVFRVETKSSCVFTLESKN